MEMDGLLAASVYPLAYLNQLKFYSTDFLLESFSKNSLKLSPQSQMEFTTGSRNKPISLS